MFAIKRKEAVDKAVRRCARERLDRAIAVLNDSPGGFHKTGTKVNAEVSRLLALLALVSPSMESGAAQRERKVLRMAARRARRGWDVARYLDARIASAGKNLLGVTADAVLGGELQTGNDLMPKKRRGPDPVVHRLIADLAEVRMRAGYWHVAGEGFDAVSAGLRSTYTRARRLVSSQANAGDTAVALARLADQLRWLERCWPGVMEAQRQRVSALADSFELISCDALVLDALNESEDAQRVRAYLEAQATETMAHTQRESLALFSETPARFLERHAGYWQAWRGGVDIHTD